MDDARLAAVAALIELARSPHFQDRADAGHGLVCFADVPAAREALLALVLDAGDTYVTRTTAEALLRRGEATSLAVLSAGAATADAEQLDQFYSALSDVHGVFERDRDAAVATCRTFANDPDEQVRSGATALVDALGALRPTLRTAESY